jgi:hypothetical protein
MNSVREAMTPLTINRSIERMSLKNADSDELVSHLRGIAVRALRGMYVPREGLFVFRSKKTSSGVVYEGLSRRYTAIVLIALAGEKSDVAENILEGHSPRDVSRRLAQSLPADPNLGDAALTLWASCALQISDRQRIREALRGLLLPNGRYPTVEIAWALKAFCVDCEAEAAGVRERLAERLISAFNPGTGIFPHFIGPKRSLRDHVACFADQVYPIQALSAYHRLSGNKNALEVANRCAEKICELQGAGGQWWWHYDRRTGKVIEGYPVYCVHQDAMAPMALLELHLAGGPDYSTAIARGLSWMSNAPEINFSLIDSTNCAIWRKVDRRGPRKFCRFFKAAASWIHASFPISWMDRWFTPVFVDYECRPYHLAWLLYAWPETRTRELKGDNR